MCVCFTMNHCRHTSCCAWICSVDGFSSWKRLVVCRCSVASQPDHLRNLALDCAAFGPFEKNHDHSCQSATNSCKRFTRACLPSRTALAMGQIRYASNTHADLCTHISKPGECIKDHLLARSRVFGYDIGDRYRYSILHSHTPSCSFVQRHEEALMVLSQCEPILEQARHTRWHAAFSNQVSIPSPLRLPVIVATFFFGEITMILK